MKMSKEKLEQELNDLLKVKETKHAEQSTKTYDVVEVSKINQKDLLYILSKISWQGKEALGVVRINELIKHALSKTKGMLQLTSTEMNAILYLLLRVKSNSKYDAEVYVNSVYPLVARLEELVTEAKQEYDNELKDTISRISEIESELSELEVLDAKTAQDETAQDAPVKTKKSNKQK